VGERVGYLRVSTADQNTERQLDGVPVDRVFEDKGLFMIEGVERSAAVGL